VISSVEWLFRNARYNGTRSIGKAHADRESLAHKAKWECGKLPTEKGFPNAVIERDPKTATAKPPALAATNFRGDPPLNPAAVGGQEEGGRGIDQSSATLKEASFSVFGRFRRDHRRLSPL
jgi:hypothetical protein